MPQGHQAWKSCALKSDLRGIEIHHGDRFPVKNQHYLVISEPGICFPLNRQVLDRFDIRRVIFEYVLCEGIAAGVHQK
ncbi:MAG: hypothetical protein CHKLHMKO_00188 [Candidatus Argoarchaeum ethanivorans]|uniref:Uncharacterized protein n=1 Tax=Candidatus Argoarchaeum ethanivorans TaxID=2608793 RepID=A0A811TA63_9EURY|nr:MAG: hypothetical protein CHKLHMKO_00188 [Candidatus Argoarchaeum ethanivorans]